MYAHTLDGRPESEWEPLPIHLAEVADMSELFTGRLRAPGWGRWLGQHHDLGKAAEAFREYLQRSHAARDSADAGEEHIPRPGRVDHSTFGARHAMGVHPIAGPMMAFCIAGHHAGLPDWTGQSDTDTGTLEHRLSAAYSVPAISADDVQRALEGNECAAPTLPAFLVAPPLSEKELPFRFAFFTRMLFSALVDADRTCTERFADRAQAEERALPRPSGGDLLTPLRAHLAELNRGPAGSDVIAARRTVQLACVDAAPQPPGFFSLQVPTGGGKTLASLLFALEHAQAHGHERVIVAIPFTSIIEQTADVYRAVLGPLAERGLIEHHTNLQPTQDTRANKLGTENWDAPLVVTTNVQLLETLFAAHTTPCRKLHNIANSVIVLDEAQTLPVELLKPTLTALRELVERYGCSIVLCTATQPALEHSEEFPIGLPAVQPIIAETTPLYASLRRVEVKRVGSLADTALAGRLALQPRVLAIVNTRAHALAAFALLCELVPPDECFHLSTLMCGAHRRATLATIRERMSDPSAPPCRVVSTQLVEAGVDLDFPVVYRAAAGIDSIAQAAGRCNREGRLALGTTFVFEPEDHAIPAGFLRQAAQAGREVMAVPGCAEDPLSPHAVREFFYRLYWQYNSEWDKHGVLTCFSRILSPARVVFRFQFREAAAAYRLIRNEQIPVLVPFDTEAEKMLTRLRILHPSSACSHLGLSKQLWTSKNPAAKKFLKLSV